MTPVTQVRRRASDTTSMDFANYLAALAANQPKEPSMEPININTPADLFNPSKRDGAWVFVGLRLIPVTLVLSWVFQAGVA